jgi:hypothetical protein
MSQFRACPADGPGHQDDKRDRQRQGGHHPETAIQLERTLGIIATFWNNLATA